MTVFENINCVNGRPHLCKSEQNLDHHPIINIVIELIICII